MSVLKNISVVWSLLHTLVLFGLLFESRYSKKKTIIITSIFITPLIIINFIATLVTDMDTYMSMILFTLTLPSLILFWIIAKKRDGRFFFTFCLMDTISLEIIYLTNIIEFYIPGDSTIFLFVSRLLIFPILEIIIYKKLRTVYLEVQKHTKKGWSAFAAISALFYVYIIVATSYPTMVTSRPEYIPGTIILFILMPVIYINIFKTLFHQHQIHIINEQKSILTLQMSNMKKRIDEFSETNNHFRMERHDFRHKMQTIANLIEGEHYDELRNLVIEYSIAAKSFIPVKYCDNAIIDAVLASYLQSAKDTKVSVGISLPEKMPVNASELATVIANALENAIIACQALPEDKRMIEIKILSKPCFMLQIKNTFNGNVTFDSEGIPVTKEEGHGYGTKSIVAFCNNNNAFYEFKAEGNIFSLRITL